MSKVGEAIQAQREVVGWTSRELARRSGFSASFICDVQAGRRDLSPASLLRITNQFTDVDSTSWLWLLAEDLWGAPIVDAMKAYAVAEQREPDAGATTGGRG